MSSWRRSAANPNVNGADFGCSDAEQAHHAVARRGPVAVQVRRRGQPQMEGGTTADSRCVPRPHPDLVHVQLARRHVDGADVVDGDAGPDLVGERGRAQRAGVDEPLHRRRVRHRHDVAAVGHHPQPFVDGRGAVGEGHRRRLWRTSPPAGLVKPDSDGGVTDDGLVVEGEHAGVADRLQPTRRGSTVSSWRRSAANPNVNGADFGCSDAEQAHHAVARRGPVAVQVRGRGQPQVEGGATADGRWRSPATSRPRTRSARPTARRWCRRCRR